MDTAKARDIAFKVLYEMEVREVNDLDGLLSLHTEDLGDKVAEFVNSVAKGVHKKNSEYNAIIESNLKGWKLDRVSKLSIAAIKLALFEIEYNEKVNANIAIAEAVKLAVEYGGDEKFVNGILGSYVRNAL